jgi:hypothetical protein
MILIATPLESRNSNKMHHPITTSLLASTVLAAVITAVEYINTGGTTSKIVLLGFSQGAQVMPSLLGGGNGQAALPKRLGKYTWSSLWSHGRSKTASLMHEQ